MDDYESDDDGYSDVSSIGSDLDDPRVDFLPVTIAMCRALYSPSSVGRTYICTRQPPCRRHNHQSASAPRGLPGIYPLDRARTGRVRGILDGRLTDDEVTAMREREREGNRALAAAQAGMRSPRRTPPPPIQVETASLSTGEDADYRDTRPHREPEDIGPQAPVAAPEMEAPAAHPLQAPPPIRVEPSQHATAPMGEANPTAEGDSREDLTNLVAQLTSALLGLNTRLERLEAPSAPPPVPTAAPQPAPAAPPLPPAPPAARISRSTPESILRTASTQAPASTTTVAPEVEFLKAIAGSTQGINSIPPPQAWYVVLKGRSPRDIGIYDNWLVVQPLVTGISHAVFKKFKTESEAEYYLAAALHSMNLDLEQRPTVADPTHRDRSSSPGPSGFHQHPSSANGPPVPGPQVPLPTQAPIFTPPSQRRSPQGGRVDNGSPSLQGTIRDPGVTPAGADPSTGRKDVLFGLQANEDGSLMRSCSPPGLTTEGQVRLADQILDSVALPGTSDGGTDETELHRISESLQAIAAGSSSNTGYPVGQRDTNYKSKKKTSICDIKSTSDLQDRLEDLEGGAEDILKYTEGNLKAVLINEGYDYEVATEYASLSPYLKISQVSLQSYISLHLHLLSIAVNEGYEEARLELAHHCKKMRRIRERYHTRLQVMCHLYCYLRDQKRNRWQSLEIQKLRLDQARMFLPFVPASIPATATGNTNPGSNADYRCPHCKTCMHSGGKKSCPWRSLTVKRAIYAAKQALHQVQAMGDIGHLGGQDEGGS